MGSNAPFPRIKHLSSYEPDYQYHVGSKCDPIEISNLNDHEIFCLDTGMTVAFEQAHLALNNKEVPIGCAVVNHDGIVLAKGRNRTNENHDGISHAEMEALEILYSLSQSSPDPIAFYKNLEFYVTVEPCIMCAAALRIAGISRVTFGCWNERFGGCGSILDAHLYYLGEEKNLFSTLQTRQVDKYKAEAINLLRRFYLLQNEKAPKPNLKANRVYKPYSEENQQETIMKCKDGHNNDISQVSPSSSLSPQSSFNDSNKTKIEIKTNQESMERNWENVEIPPFDPNINYIINSRSLNSSASPSSSNSPILQGERKEGKDNHKEKKFKPTNSIEKTPKQSQEQT